MREQYRWDNKLEQYVRVEEATPVEKLEKFEKLRQSEFYKKNLEYWEYKWSKDKYERIPDPMEKAPKPDSVPELQPLIYPVVPLQCVSCGMILPSLKLGWNAMHRQIQNGTLDLWHPANKVCPFSEKAIRVQLSFLLGTILKGVNPQNTP